MSEKLTLCLRCSSQQRTLKKLKPQQASDLPPATGNCSSVIGENDMLKSQAEFRYQADCTLLDCPPGLFLFNGRLGFKSEYHPRSKDNMEVYVVESGECFWGGTSRADDRSKLVVTPIECGD